jgi:hypothetical protein
MLIGLSHARDPCLLFLYLCLCLCPAPCPCIKANSQQEKLESFLRYSFHATSSTALGISLPWHGRIKLYQLIRITLNV